MQLILQALSRSQATPRSFPIKTENIPLTNSELQKRTVQQEGIPHDTVTNDNVWQQAEELYKRISQRNRTDEPLQKLCNALYTCDPHRTGKEFQVYIPTCRLSVLLEYFSIFMHFLAR